MREDEVHELIKHDITALLRPAFLLKRQTDLRMFITVCLDVASVNNHAFKQPFIDVDFCLNDLMTNANNGVHAELLISCRSAQSGLKPD